MARRYRSFVLLTVGLLAAARCGSSGGGSTTPTPPTATIVSVTVTGAGSPTAGDTVQLTATANFSDGTAQVVTAQATWDSSNTSIATVSASGLATFVAQGAVDLRATYKSVAGSAHVTVGSKGPPKYALAGTITDAVSGEKLANILVTILDGPDAGRSAVSDASGKYGISSVTAGSFTLRLTNTNYDTKTVPVSLSGDVTVDVQITAAASVTKFYGTYNASLKELQDTCDFPFDVGPTGTFKIDGSPNGSSMTITIVERGTTRTYLGSIKGDGSFNGTGGGIIAGFSPPKNQHEYNGSVSGTATGSKLNATEFVTFTIPCAGAQMQISYTGSK
jgi:hypothetical protein